METIIEFIESEIKQYEILLETYNQIREDFKKEGVKNDPVNKRILFYINEIKQYNKVIELIKNLKQ